MTGKVIQLDKPMTKAELRRHLAEAHPLKKTSRWSKQELIDAHRLIHFWLGR